MLTRNILIGLVALLLVLSSSAVEAQNDEPIAETNQGADILSSVSMIFGIAAFSGVVVYATEGSWSPPYWAWPQLGVSVLNISSGIWHLAASDGRVGMGIANLIVGTSLLAHGILSVLLYAPPEPDPEVPADTTVGYLIRPDLSFVEGGGTVGVSGIF